MAGRTTTLIFDGEVFCIEGFLTANGESLVEEFLESLPSKVQQKFASLFVRLGDTGKIWNERKFKHLSGTDQIFEFKIDENRVLCFFFVGKRVILTHGFKKKGSKTPKKEIERAERIKGDFYLREKS